MLSIIWLVLFVVLLGIEAVTLGLVTIWFAGGALVAFLLSLFLDNWIVQTVVFLVVSGVLLYFTRPVALRKFNSRRLKTNVEELVGKEAKVIEMIDNFNATGAAMLGGVEWSARAAQDEVKIPAGERVLIKEVRGVKLVVEPVTKLRADADSAKSE